MAELQATIDTQLKTITDLSAKASVNQKLEQQNRELNNRSENMKEEVASMKQRVKALQNDLAEERNQVNELKKYDPVKMKKNLDDNKKRLAEKTSAAGVLHPADVGTTAFWPKIDLSRSHWMIQCRSLMTLMYCRRPCASAAHCASPDLWAQN